MVKDHEKAVKLFEKESQKGESDELKQFASKTLPTLQEHLKMARDLKASTSRRKAERSVAVAGALAAGRRGLAPGQSANSIQ